MPLQNFEVDIMDIDSKNIDKYYYYQYRSSNNVDKYWYWYVNWCQYLSITISIHINTISTGINTISICINTINQSILTSAGWGLVIFGLFPGVLSVVVIVWFVVGLVCGDGRGGPLDPGGLPSNVKATYGPAVEEEKGEEQRYTKHIISKL